MKLCSKSLIVTLAFLMSPFLISNAFADALACRAQFYDKTISFRTIPYEDLPFNNVKLYSALSNDGKTELVSDGPNNYRNATLRDISTGIRTVISDDFGPIYSSFFSSDDSRVVLTGGTPLTRNTSIFDVKTKTMILDSITISKNATQAVSADAKLIARREDGMITVRDVNTNKVVMRKISPSLIPQDMMFSPDKSKLVVNGLLYSSVIDIQTGKTIYRIPSSDVKFSPDGRHFATTRETNPLVPSAERRITVRDTDTGNIIFEAYAPKGTQRSPFNPVFSSDFGAHSGIIELEFYPNTDLYPEAMIINFNDV